MSRDPGSLCGYAEEIAQVGNPEVQRWLGGVEAVAGA